MAQEQFFNEEDKESVDFQEILFRYLSYWKWIVASVVVFLVGAYVYLKCTVPVYNISSTILLKDDKRGGGVDELSTLQEWGVVSSKNNIDNEIEILKSKNLLKSVVTDLKLYVSYSLNDRIPSVQLYKYSPVVADMDSVEQLVHPVFMTLLMSEDGKVKVEGVCNGEKIGTVLSELPAVVNTASGNVYLSLNESVEPIYDENISVSIVHPLSVARGYAGRLGVAPTSKTTSVINLTLSETNINRGKDFLNKLVDVYNLETINDKNRVALNTERFLDARLAKLDLELGSAERDLEQYKKKEKITDIQADAQLALQTNNEYQKQRVEVETQLNLVKYLENYMKDDANMTKLVPSNIGITDPTLSSLTAEYNALLIERDRLALTSSDENPALSVMDNTIQSVYTTILASLRSIYEGLMISKNDLDRQAELLEVQIGNVPTIEREYAEKARQQQIKSQLYLILLQKREENSLALSATTTNAKVIDDAFASGPVSPNRSNIYMIAFVLGIALPVGIIYLRDLLNFKVQNPNDIRKLTDASILGEVPLAETDEKIAVKENVNDVMAEAFRGIRTNLQFMLENVSHKVIMVTSSVPGEGKSFTAINLAISMALVDKRVLLIGLDVRKPALAKYLNIDSKSGVTNYLANLEADLSKLIRNSRFNANLDVLPAGPIPPNPAELLLSERLDTLVKDLRDRYDYIIIDTAPVGLVSDSLIVGRVADRTIYVTRANVTYKRHLNWVNDLAKTKKLPALALVLNGMQMGKRSYGYGYGYGYSYGYGYGYGYGDGEHRHHKKSRKRRWMKR